MAMGEVDRSGHLEEPPDDVEEGQYELNRKGVARRVCWVIAFKVETVEVSATAAVDVDGMVS